MFSKIVLSKLLPQKKAFPKFAPSKNTFEKNFFEKIALQAWKTSYILGGNLQSLKIKIFLYSLIYFLFVEKELCKHKGKKKKFAILSFLKKQNFPN